MADDLLQATLAVSLTAINVLRPVLGPAEEVLDFVLEYVNPAGQLLAGLPEQPAGTLGTLFPHARANGLLDFYRQVFTTGEAGTYNFNYEAEGRNEFYLVAARRSGPRLVASLSDSANHERSAVEQMLRASQAREQAARAEADLQRQQLHNMLQQAPAMICVNAGPHHVFEFVNPPYQALVGQRPLVGLPVAVAMPELAGQSIFELLDEVYQTGNTFYANEMLVRLDHDNNQPAQLDRRYYNFIYQARYSLAGVIDGIFTFAYEVTAQVLARYQVQDLNEELAATNEELMAANEEFLASNAELGRVQQLLRQLNQELENHVAERTQELVLAQAETERQRQRLSRFFSQAPAAICILDGPELTYELVNGAYQRLFPGRQLLGLPLLEALPELANQPMWRTLRRVYETGETNEEIGIRIPVAKYEGGPLEDLYFHYIQQARYDEHGRIDGVLIFTLDMTEQFLAQQQRKTLQTEVLVAAQRQMQQREDLYRLFERTPAAISLLRGYQHRIEYLNPAFQQLFPGRRLLGRPVGEALPEVLAQGFVALLDRVYRTGETYYGSEVPLHIAPLADAPAEIRYLNFTYQAYQETGQTAGISVFAYDVTEQVLARRQRATAQAQLQAVLEQAPVAIGIIRGPEYIIEIANPLIASIWGRTAEQLLGQPLFEALPEVRDQGFKELLDKVLRTGEAFVAQEVTSLLQRPEGLQTVHLNFVYQPLRNAAGHLTSIAIVATEVTEQVAGRRQVAEANERLRASNAELDLANQQLTRTNVDLDNFIYTASHDLKAPITNIDGLLTALQEQLPPAVRRAEQVQPLLAMMEGAVERFQKTIAHLTDISKLQQAHDQVAEAVNLAALVEDVRLDLAHELAAAQAQLLVDVSGGASLSFSPKNLRSIVYNLLSNAIKYRAEGRPAVVQLRSSTTAQGQLLLQVQDNGLGLSESQQGQLFTMFQRLHNHVEGSGVGLYMVKKIVENAGGTITVQSQLGVGTTFTVMLFT
ncbi:PAS domain-containing protein [Hymenobacter sp. H14-R3]|uniref:PAS domain-containing protein n=1 Tax=Hymenobacter sp. H14-R3 TaxID=3046308 RepID=UPI0024B96EBA|nr:PAS domain-containing protein [Hymenobacter sp. H14-R3]MDJ0364093.1 PAS domain-containing protein [Hymenobacter sp. H14-R3]